MYSVTFFEYIFFSFTVRWNNCGIVQAQIMEFLKIRDSSTIFFSKLHRKIILRNYIQINGFLQRNQMFRISILNPSTVFRCTNENNLGNAQMLKTYFLRLFYSWNCLLFIPSSGKINVLCGTAIIKLSRKPAKTVKMKKILLP